MWPFKKSPDPVAAEVPQAPARRWDAFDAAPAADPGVVREVSMADALLNSATGLGGSRDKRFYSDYALATTPLSESQLRARYRTSWMARSIIDIPVEDMVREWVERKWKDSTPDDLAALKRSEMRVGAKAKVREALTWAGVFGGGVVIPMIRGQEDFTQPLDLNRIKKGDLLGLLAKDKSRIYAIGGAPDRTPGPNFGKPLGYGVVDFDKSFQIHWTWVIRFEGRVVPETDFITNNYWHDSELQHVDTALKDFDGAIENVAAMMWEAKIDVIKTSLAAMLAAKGGAAIIQQRYLDAAIGKGNHRIMLLNKDEEYDSKPMAFGGVHDLLGDHAVFACGAARIPMVKLFGQSAPGMNSTGTVDEGLYYDRIASEQEWKMLPSIARLDQILIRDALGAMPENYDLEANPLEQVGPVEESDIELKNAQRDVALLAQKALTVGMILRRLKMAGSYSGIITDEDIAKLEAAAEKAAAAPPPPAPVPGGVPPPANGQPPANGAPKNGVPAAPGT